jgi:hypothetical protein
MAEAVAFCGTEGAIKNHGMNRGHGHGTNSLVFAQGRTISMGNIVTCREQIKRRIHRRRRTEKERIPPKSMYCIVVVINYPNAGLIRLENGVNIIRN